MPCAICDKDVETEAIALAVLDPCILDPNDQSQAEYREVQIEFCSNCRKMVEPPEPFSMGCHVELSGEDSD